MGAGRVESPFVKHARATSAKTATPTSVASPRPAASLANLSPAWPKGQSGNPNGRPKSKPVTDAYRKCLEMGLVKLASYHPANTGEAIARALILKTFREATDKKGRLLSAVVAMKEVADRVEGHSVPGDKQAGAKRPARIGVKFNTQGEVMVAVEMPQENGEEEQESE